MCYHTVKSYVIIWCIFTTIFFLFSHLHSQSTWYFWNLQCYGSNWTRIKDEYCPLLWSIFISSTLAHPFRDFMTYFAVSSITSPMCLSMSFMDNICVWTFILEGFHVQSNVVSKCSKVWHLLARVAGRVWQGVANYGKVWQGEARYGKVLQGVARCGMMWQSVARCGKVWQSVERCCKVWQGVARFGKVWQGLAKCGKVW